ncbi:ISAon1 family transposase N-terminal region protein [Reichenbachiella agarivorans]
MHFKGNKLTSKGFYDEVTIQDFPVRGKALLLEGETQKRLNEDTGKNVRRDWKMVKNSTRKTEEFALLLKRNS